MFSTARTAELLLLSSALCANACIRTLNIVNKQIAPDGFERSAVLVDGQFPGPLVYGNKGDEYELTVVNQLHDNTMRQSTSVHWHGITQHGTAWADGAAFVTQCPISPNQTFVYNFNITDQAGSFWYHSHLSTQVCDGLRGPFVVYDPNDPHKDLYDVDDETTIITLADWYHTPAPTLNKQTGGPVIADSTLINGRGRWNNNGSIDRTQPLSVINVTRGKKYRMRLFALSCDPNYVFSIDGHAMTIIEVDGVSTKPLTVDSIQIFAGQRYSFVLDASQVEGNYWIRAIPNSGILNTIGGVNSAILRYTDAPPIEPTTDQPPSFMPLFEWNLQPLVETPVPGGPSPGAVDKQVIIDLTFNGTRFFANNATYVAPTVPVLLQILSGAHDARDLMPTGSVIELPGDSSVEVVIPGGVIGGGHPFHLHGHSFHVVQSAGNFTPNYINPPIRDVVNIGEAGDNVTIRFNTDNAGPWILHCHIEWHLEVGMAVVFAEDTPRIAEAVPVPDSWKQLCPAYDALSPDQQ